MWTAALVAFCAFALGAGGSALVIQINPEARLTPSSIPLSFAVTNPGQLTLSQSVNITAWVRSLPGQQILVTAQPISVSGPSGPLPPSSISWNGLMSTATGGATTALCTSGAFSGGPAQPLIANWNQSGIATCNLLLD